jgi:CRISPR-associated endonuclease/helicase Cas3
LYAKSADRCGNRRTLIEHTFDVIETSAALVEATGAAQLRALGLESIGLDRLRRDLTLLALLHDLGKANCCFQRLVTTDPRLVQPLRHEAVSYWIARRPELRAWIEQAVGDATTVDLLLWAIAGHHRKFPPGQLSGEPMEVFLAHPDFRTLLALGASRLGLPKPPSWDTDATIVFAPLRLSVARDFAAWAQEAQAMWTWQRLREKQPEQARYLALLKASLIGADVAGSIRRRGDQPMAEWIAQAFANVPTAADLDNLIARRLGTVTTPDPEKDDFRRRVGEATTRVTLVTGGCGCGKTLSAYNWSARRAPGRRLFFCYPTTGTASEGYRDYLKDADLPAALIHGRAEVDMQLLGLGDDEPDRESKENGDNEPGRSAIDSAGALEHWSTPLVGCTVDTVLGLMQNNRRGVYLWPSIAGAAVVFDEVHAYDDDLFTVLLRFLQEARNVPCLLMTASLPEPRRRRIEEALRSIGESLGLVPGPERHETIRRYRREEAPDPWKPVESTLGRPGGGKVLWVVNTVDEAIRTYDEASRKGLDPLLYHSRYRYRDRVRRHDQVIQAFRRHGPALAITTQVAEMSLDLSADLLVTQLAPIYALIQRLGRLNRYAQDDDPWPFVVTVPESPLPYTQPELDEARSWLDALGFGGLSQRQLAQAWPRRLDVLPTAPACAWLDGGFVTVPMPLRKASPGIEILLPEDARAVAEGAVRPEEVRIPMPPPPGRDWRAWPETAMCKVPPEGCVQYHELRGARWIR